MKIDIEKELGKYPQALAWLKNQTDAPELTRFGVWEVRQPDTNFDLSGSHECKLTGRYSGIFWHVLCKVSTFPTFYVGGNGYEGSSIKAFPVTAVGSPEEERAAKAHSLETKMRRLQNEINSL